MGKEIMNSKEDWIEYNLEVKNSRQKVLNYDSQDYHLSAQIILFQEQKYKQLYHLKTIAIKIYSTIHKFNQNFAEHINCPCNTLYPLLYFRLLYNKFPIKFYQYYNDKKYLLNPPMEKKKSQKRINKSSSVHTKGDDQQIPVKTMLKQIRDLKKQLITIKSKKQLEKYSNIIHNESMKQNQIDERDTKLKQTTGETNKYKEEQKQNKCICICQGKGSLKRARYQSEAKPSLKIDLLLITAPKSRQTKLKLNIQSNKIKSILQKIHHETNETEFVQLLIAEFNTTMAYINSIMKEYEYELSSKTASFEEMRQELSQLTNKFIKTAQKHSNQKHLSSAHIEQIAELKRHLSYYIQLMQESKQQALKYSKDYCVQEAYLKQLQQSNEILKKQLKQARKQRQQYFIGLKQVEQKLRNKQAQYALIKNDLDLALLSLEKDKDKRKQGERSYEKLAQQFRTFVESTKMKEFNLFRLEDENKQLKAILQTIKNQQKDISLEIANKNIEIDRLQRQNSILTISLRQKQQAIQVLNEEIRNWKHTLEQEEKNSQRLNENLKFCEMEIHNMSEQIDELKRANQRYKNLHFRNKVIQQQKEENEYSNQKSLKKNSNNKLEQSMEKKIKSRNIHPSHSKKRQMILGQLVQMIDKAKKVQDSQQSSEGQH